MPGIQEPRLTTAVYHAVIRSLEAGRPPTLMLFPQDTHPVRYVRAEYLKNKYNHAFEPKRVAEALKIRDKDSDANRYSGQARGTEITKRGGLYTSRHHAPMMNEIWHHSDDAVDIPHALAATGVIQMSLVRPLLVLDLSRYSPETAKFLTKLETDRDVRSALDASRHPGARLEDLLMHGSDFSVCRALGLAAANSPYVEGLQAGTARLSDRLGETGDNLILYGSDLWPLHDKVRAETVTLFGSGGRTKEVQPTTHRVTFDTAKGEYRATGP